MSIAEFSYNNKKHTIYQPIIEPNYIHWKNCPVLLSGIDSTKQA
jgi:hypothetical protein